MAARSGMAELITELRSMTYTGTADYSIGSESYWSDDHMQAELDKNRADFNVSLDIVGERVSNSVVYHDYYYDPTWIERADGGTAVFRVEDSSGSVVATADYSINYDARHIRFTADQGGTAYYLRGRRYDLNRAAASIWDKKAAYYSSKYDIKIDNHQMSRSQLIQHCNDMRKHYSKRAGGRIIRVQRNDVK